MNEDDRVDPLPLHGTIYLLEIMNRDSRRALEQAKTPIALTRVVSHLIDAPLSPVGRVVEKINRNALSAEFTPVEQRLIGVLRVYGEIKENISDAQRNSHARSRAWVDEHVETFERSFRESVETHLSKQTEAIARLTDDQLKRVRLLVVKHAKTLARSFAYNLRASSIQPQDVHADADGAVNALVNGAMPSLETLRIQVRGVSQMQLSVSTATITSAFLPDRSALRSIVEGAWRTTLVEVDLPDAVRQVEVAATALIEASSRSRWDAAGSTH